MKFSGIYRIRNLVTGDTYVGQSVNITQRWWEHRNKLAAAFIAELRAGLVNK